MRPAADALALAYVKCHETAARWFVRAGHLDITEARDMARWRQRRAKPAPN